MAKDELVKITVLVSPETVEVLAHIKKQELTGSRGRSIDWLARKYGP